MTYDAQLRLVGVTDAIGQVTTLSYDLTGSPLLITKITDPFGRSALFDYNSSGQLVRITDVIGIRSEFEYGSSDFVKALTTPYGTTLFATTSGINGHVDYGISATDPVGGTERLDWVLTNPNVPASEPASSVPTGFASMNSGLANYSTYYWDKRAWALYPGDYTKTEITRWNFSSVSGIADSVGSQKKPLENRVWYLYAGATLTHGVGPMNKPLTVARVLDDGSSQTYRYEYNSRGLKTKEIDPVGRETRYTYGTGSTPDVDQATGTGIDLLKIEQKNGANYDLLESRTYNAQHELLTTTDAAGQTTTNTYNAGGQILTTTTPPRAGITENRTTTYVYDTNGYLQSITGPATGTTTSYTYDGYGRVRTVTDAESYTVTMDYDVLDRRTTVTYPDGTYEQMVYTRLDAQDRRDRLGRWSHTFYDALRRVVSTRDAAGRTTTQQWCTCGSLEKVVDANNNATTWERDLQGRVTREIRADGKDRLFTYEATTSRLKQIEDSLASRQVTTYDYFLDDQRKQVTYSNTVNATPTVSYTYDPTYRRVVTMTDGTGMTTWTYNSISGTPALGAGRLASVDGPLANDSVSYTYDELGRMVSHGLSGFSTTLSYDALGRVVALGSPVGSFTYTFDGITPRPLSLAYPNGQTTNYLYFGNSADRRLQEIKHLSPTSVILSKLNYTYDAVGNIKAWTQQYGTNPAKVYDLGYDLADQLTAATLKSTDPTPLVLKRYGYGYDALGNRTAEQVDDAVTGGTFDNRNQLTSRQPGGALSFKGTLNEPATVTVAGQPATVGPDNSFRGQAPVASGTSSVAVVATDPSGNTRTNTYQVAQAGSTTNYTYDANGNLTGDGTKTYEWDGAYRLVRIAQGATELVRFTYDGLGRRSQKIAGGVTRTYVYDGSDIIEERLSTATTLSHVYGLGIDQALARRDNAGAVTYYLADHLGSVVLETNASGAASLTREYDPFGNLLQGGSASGYAFTGRELDAESGLLYYRARYYDPTSGRFLSEDPMPFRIGAPLYAYVENSPSNRTDPSGLRSQCPVKPGTMYYTCCKGGRTTFCRGPDWNHFTEPRLRKCIIDHEWIHVEDRSCDCAGKPDGPLCDTHEGNKRTECRAYRDTLECLSRGSGPQTAQEVEYFKVAMIGVGWFCFDQRLPGI
jgi:RHS repeat-associated protein